MLHFKILILRGEFRTAAVFVILIIQLCIWMVCFMTLLRVVILLNREAIILFTCWMLEAVFLELLWGSEGIVAPAERVR